MTYLHYPVILDILDTPAGNELSEVKLLLNMEFQLYYLEHETDGDPDSGVVLNSCLSL